MAGKAVIFSRVVTATSSFRPSALGGAHGNAGASGGMRDAVTAGKYYKGLAVFTIVKGGAMYQATVAGQKFSYKPAG
jgi:hypothetical protein